MPDLHDRLLSELNRRLDIARAATPGPWLVVDPNEGSEHLPFWMIVNDAFLNPPADEDAPWIAVELHTGDRSDADHIQLHAPADAILRYTRDLAVLERHANDLGDCATCSEEHDDEDSDGNRYAVPSSVPYPCREVVDLAESLGIPTTPKGDDGG